MLQLSAFPKEYPCALCNQTHRHALISRISHKKTTRFYFEAYHFLINFFFIVAPFPFTSLYLFTPHSHLSLSADLIKYRTRRTRWRRTASALSPTDWFRSRGTLCTQISLWRSANHRPGRSRARERERGGGKMRDKGGKKSTYKKGTKRTHIWMWEW